MLRLVLAMMCLATPAAAELSNAAKWLRDEQIAEGCGGAGGTFDPLGLIEIDLNGDGALDLILDHAEISCDRDWQRSDFCGAQVCSIYLYIREDGLLVRRDEVLGLLQSISDEPLPVLRGIGHGGGAWSAVWVGNGFGPST